MKLFRSGEIPKRDDEKEIERKARAKRARESRRSTQVRMMIMMIIIIIVIIVSMIMIVSFLLSRVDTQILWQLQFMSRIGINRADTISSPCVTVCVT